MNNQKQMQQSVDIKEIFAWGGEISFQLRIVNERLSQLSRELAEEKAKNAPKDEEKENDSEDKKP